MAIFVLVHGAWIGAEIWAPVAERLRREGHDVYAPTLTGVGARSHLLRADIDLDTHVMDIVNLIRFHGLDDLVLCGHSYGGMVVTGVADSLPDKIRALVYLDAFVPKDGQSLLDLTSNRPAPVAVGIAFPPLPPTAFALSGEKEAFYVAHATPQPSLTFTQRLRLSGGIDRVKRRVYIYANVPQPTTFTQFYERFRDAPGWKAHTLACTHLVQADMPEALTRILVDAGSPIY